MTAHNIQFTHITPYNKAQQYKHALSSNVLNQVVCVCMYEYGSYNHQNINVSNNIYIYIHTRNMYIDEMTNGVRSRKVIDKANKYLVD